MVHRLSQSSSGLPRSVWPLKNSPWFSDLPKGYQASFILDVHILFIHTHITIYTDEPDPPNVPRHEDIVSHLLF